MLASRNRRAMRGAVTPIALVALLGLALVKSHVYRVYGGYVERVDPAQFATDVERVAITGVNVLSADGESMLPEQTVVLDEGRILSIAGGAEAPAGVRVIDGRGKYLIPGLVDSHVHLRKQPNDLLLYIANGVTQVRDLAGSKGDLADQGYDALKTYANIDMGSYRAINAEAAKRGIHTVGHLPFDMTLAELGETQQRELAHIEELIKPLQGEYAALGRDDYADNFPRFVAGRADAIIDDLLANDIVVNTTLWLSEVVGEQAFRLRDALRKLPLEYANPAMVEGSPYVDSVGWLPGRNQFEQPADTDTEARQRIERNWAARAEAHRVLFRRMVERGVRIIAGTDATSHLVIAGFSLHDELESLARNGMTPAQALRAATRTPTQLMRDDAGVIAEGRRADLLLLRENPLEDIRHAMAIEAVVLGGRWLDRERLNAMLDAVKEAHASSRKFDLNAL